MIRMFHKETFFNRLYYAVRGSELTERTELRRSEIHYIIKSQLRKNKFFISCYASFSIIQLTLVKQKSKEV
jgi:hypothetical protein